MKMTLLLTTLIAFAGISSVSADEALNSAGDKASQARFVRAEARVAGGRADRSRILVAARHAEAQPAQLKARKTAEGKSVQHRQKILGGRNAPK